MFFGWWIVATVFLAQLFMVGFITYGYPFIVVPVKEEFGASSTQVNLAMTLASGAGILVPPVVGPLVDRWTARGLMGIGLLSLVGALALLSVTQSIFQFVAVFAVFMALGNTLLGPITGSAVISRWFTANRGRALGIAATGTSVGGVVIPTLITMGIEALGWRMTLQALAGLVLVCVLPFLLFAFRDHPPEQHTVTDASVAAPAHGGDVSEQQPSTGQIVGSRPFWVIGLSLGMLFMSYTAVLANLGLYAEGAGLEMSAGRNLIWLIAAFGFIGKLALGAATDRIGLRPGLWLALGLAAVGIGLLSLEPSYPLMLVAASLMGLAAGGMLPVWGGMVAAAFGVGSFGRAMGLMMPLISVLVMPGFQIAAWSDDTTGSFALAMRFFVALIGVAFVLLFALRLPEESAQPSTA